MDHLMIRKRIKTAVKENLDRLKLKEQKEKSKEPKKELQLASK